MATLPPPEFVAIDPAAIEADLIARYEARSKKTLYPAQIERLFIDQIVYALTLNLEAIQHAGEQMLVRYSRSPVLDYLGDLVETPRLLAAAATTTFRFTATAATISRVIPMGTSIATSDSKLIFTTDQDVMLSAGMTSTQVRGTCQTAGVVGNDWAIGQLTTIENPPFDGLTVINDTVSSGGAEDETDERYRERIILAPEAYTTAGSRGSYRYLARSVHQLIGDVAVLGPDDPGGPAPGHVAVYVLTDDGLPGQELIDQVETVLSGEKVRPLCDTVHCYPATEVQWSLRARLTYFTDTDKATARAAALKAITAYVDARRSRLGQDIVPEQIIAALQVTGIYRVTLDEPGYRVIEPYQWSNCISIELIDGDSTDG